MELAYKGSEYAGCQTRVYVEEEDGPGGGRHQYKVVHVQDAERTDEAHVRINFQRGPVVEVGVNGVQDEGLLAVLIDRLQRFQKGLYSCRENALVLTKLQEAQHWMEHRKQDRARRGVEGKHEA
jgi:hypothetical protein